MHYVYLLQSDSHPDQRYIGFTGDLRSRLKKHNQGEVPHTAKFRPWSIRAYIAVETRETALSLERYLKSGSGRAFAAKRLWPMDALL